MRALIPLARQGARAAGQGRPQGAQTAQQTERHTTHNNNTHNTQRERTHNIHNNKRTIHTILIIHRCNTDQGIQDNTYPPHPYKDIHQ